MSKFESAALNRLYAPDQETASDLSRAILTGVGSLNQFDKTPGETEHLYKTGVLSSAAKILASEPPPCTAWIPKEDLKPKGNIWVEPSTILEPHDKKPGHHCDCDHEHSEADRKETEERQRIAGTLNKYFSQIDESHWYNFGKDGQLDRDEIVKFLSSDAASQLTQQETVDLVKVLQRYDQIKDADFDIWDCPSTGITVDDVWAYGASHKSAISLLGGLRHPHYPYMTDIQLSKGSLLE